MPFNYCSYIAYSLPKTYRVLGYVRRLRKSRELYKRDENSEGELDTSIIESFAERVAEPDYRTSQAKGKFVVSPKRPHPPLSMHADPSHRSIFPSGRLASGNQPQTAPD
jgi:hypothetical protein